MSGAIVSNISINCVEHIKVSASALARQGHFTHPPTPSRGSKVPLAGAPGGGPGMAHTMRQSLAYGEDIVCRGFDSNPLPVSRGGISFGGSLGDSTSCRQSRRSGGSFGATFRHERSVPVYRVGPYRSLLIVHGICREDISSSVLASNSERLVGLAITF